MKIRNQYFYLHVKKVNNILRRDSKGVPGEFIMKGSSMIGKDAIG